MRRAFNLLREAALGVAYTGERDERGVPHGRGKLVFSSGDSYTGEFLHGARHGRGVFTDAASGNRYDGQWKEDKRQSRRALRMRAHVLVAADEDLSGQGVLWVVDDKGELCASGETLEMLGGSPRGSSSGDSETSGSDAESDIIVVRPPPRRPSLASYAPGGRRLCPKYEGEWENDEMHGRGVMRLPAGAAYRGEFVRGERTGRGVLTSPAGDRYEGELLRGRFHGTGTMRWASGHEYTGQWRHGRRTGRGVFSAPSSGLTRGGSVARQPAGAPVRWPAGRLTPVEALRVGDGAVALRPARPAPQPLWLPRRLRPAPRVRPGPASPFPPPGAADAPRSSVYDGEWEEDQRHGRGTCLLCAAAPLRPHGAGGEAGGGRTSGERYEGQWSRDRPHGFGALTDPGGTVYEGEWVEGRRRGAGSCRYASRALYTGEWRDDERSGLGTMRYPSGAIYTGEWVRGEREGAGCLACPDTGGRWEGNWRARRRRVDGMRHGAGSWTVPALAAPLAPSASAFADVGCPEEGGAGAGPAPAESADGSPALVPGAVYEGEWHLDRWVTGRRHRWTVEYPSGDKYYGTIDAHGRRHGIGTLKSAGRGGEVYQGEWREGVAHGAGSLCYASGDRFEGFFDEGIRHGPGCYEWASGARLEGLPHAAAARPPAPQPAMALTRGQGVGQRRAGPLGAYYPAPAARRAAPPAAHPPPASRRPGRPRGSRPAPPTRGAPAAPLPRHGAPPRAPARRSSPAPPSAFRPASAPTLPPPPTPPVLSPPPPAIAGPAEEAEGEGELVSVPLGGELEAGAEAAPVVTAPAETEAEAEAKAVVAAPAQPPGAPGLPSAEEGAPKAPAAEAPPGGEEGPRSKAPEGVRAPIEE
eukprot:tig00020911_g15768.t1